MTKTHDVLIIGGGVIGVCSAYYLAQMGWTVTLLEKAEICAGCSYGNAGLVVPSHSIPLAAPGVLGKALKWMLNPESPFYIRPRLSPELISWLWRFRGACTTAHVRRALPVLRDLSYASLVLLKELAAIEGFHFGYRQNGVLAVFRTETGYEQGAREARLLEEAGIPAKHLNASEVRSIEPGLRPEVSGGVYFPDDAHLIPDAFVRGLARIAERKGVRIRTSTEVLGLRTRGRRIVAVETTEGHFQCDEVVLAAGSWSSEIARGLRLDLPIQPAKGYSVTFRRPPNSPTVPLLLGEAKVGVTPMGETLRFAGTLELAGLDLSINRRRLDAMIRSAALYLASTQDLAVMETWRGLRPCTPDGLPLIGRLERVENLIVATGHAMVGVSLGPITGKLVAQLASDEEPMVDISLLRPDRFSRAQT